MLKGFQGPEAGGLLPNYGLETPNPATLNHKIPSAVYLDSMGSFKIYGFCKFLQVLLLGFIGSMSPLRLK